MLDNSLSDFVASLDDKSFKELQTLVNERSYREKLGFSTYHEVANLFRPHPNCPHCESENTRKDGRTASGLLSFECKHCGRKFNQLTSTIFEGSKQPFVVWLQFLELMHWHNSTREISDVVGISLQTAFEWRHRVFATVKSYQEALVLSGTIWIDETYVSDWKQTGKGAKKRGLSSQKYCIALAIDKDKHVFAFVSGKGKPSSKKIRAALEKHIDPGSTIIHDKERSHKALIEALKATDFSYKADSKDEEYLEKMALVNYYCGWLKRYLERFVGMDQEGHLQDYLNWYVYRFALSRDQETWPVLGRLVRHLLLIPATFRSSRSR